MARFYIELPQWQHNAWSRIGLRDLANYSRYFNFVEGNTTFYALPKQETVQRWHDMTHDNFRFCFKFPSDISHKAALRNCNADLQAFYHCLEPLNQRIGQLWLQLPATFGPDELPRMRSRKSQRSRCTHCSLPTSRWCALSTATYWQITCAGSPSGSRSSRSGNSSISLTCLSIHRITAIHRSRRKKSGSSCAR